MKFPSISDDQEIIAILGVATVVAMITGQKDLAQYLLGGMLVLVNPTRKGQPPAPLGEQGV